MVHSGNPEGEVAPSPQLSEDTEFDKAESLPSSDETRVDSLNGPPAQEAPHSEVERSRGKIVIIMVRRCRRTSSEVFVLTPCYRLL